MFPSSPLIGFDFRLPGGQPRPARANVCALLPGGVNCVELIGRPFGQIGKLDKH